MKFKNIFPLFLLLLCFSCSDKILLEKSSDIQKAVTDELVSSSSGGKISEFVKAKNIKGEYTMDITVEGKGRTLTVTPVSSNGGNISSQNSLKDYLVTYVYNFRMKPGQKEKVHYTFKF